MSEAAEMHVDDGRRARRDRNKHAVVGAYLDLIRGGNPRPSVADVAERSGVSHRSVFRYFADKDDLTRTAIEHQLDFVGPMATLTVGPGAPLDERISRFVERRLELFEVLAPVARLSRSLAQLRPIIAEELASSREHFRNQVNHLFSAEGDAAALAALDVMCSFEAVELMLHDQGLSAAETADVLRVAIRRLLTP